MTSSMNDSYQRKLKAILAEQKSDDQETTNLYENKLLANSIIKLVIENFPNKKVVGEVDPLKVSQLLFADAVKVKKIPNIDQIGLQIKSCQRVQYLFQVRKQLSHKLSFITYYSIFLSNRNLIQRK
jgi:hypothetical protein